jgi:hypothetical protein
MRGLDRSKPVIASPSPFQFWQRSGGYGEEIAMFDRDDVGRLIETLMARIALLRERDGEQAARLIPVLEEVVEDLRNGRLPSRRGSHGRGEG